MSPVAIILSVVAGIVALYVWKELSLLCVRLAMQQGRDRGTWTVLAVIDPVLGLTLLTLLPPL
jgi:hypothetical protein